MSTRGVIAVRIDGETKGSYNHSDSYPTWLGNQVLEYLRTALPDLEEERRKARALTAIAPNQKPTAADIKRLEKYTNLGVSESSTKDWYCLLRGTQGDLAAILDAGLYDPFPVPDQEWSYVVDFDNEVLGVYEGNERVATYPFNNLPESFASDYTLPATA